MRLKVCTLKQAGHTRNLQTILPSVSGRGMQNRWLRITNLAEKLLSKTLLFEIKRTDGQY